MAKKFQMPASFQSSVSWTAGAYDFDHSLSTGAFKTGSGAVSLNGDVTVASGKNFTLASGAFLMSGSPGGQGAGVRYASGAGTTTDWYFNAATGGQLYFAIGQSSVFSVQIGGVTLSSGKGLAMSGTSTLTTGTGDTTIGGMTYFTPTSLGNIARMGNTSYSPRWGTQLSGTHFLATGVNKTASDNNYYASTGSNSLVNHRIIEFAFNGVVTFYYQAYAGADGTTLAATAQFAIESARVYSAIDFHVGSYFIHYTNNARTALGGAFSGSGNMAIFIANSNSIPSSNPTGGGLMYVESGALKYRGSSGTITTLGVA